MFEHFTFGAQAQTSSPQYEDDSHLCSPKDCSFPLPAVSNSYFPPPLPGQKGVCEIVHAFSQQKLYPDEAPARSIWSSRLPSPDLNMDPSSTIEDHFTPDEMSYVSTRRGMASVQSSIPPTQSLSNRSVPRSTSSTVACRRLQRQLNVQLQSCSNHIKDINSLVSDMINTNNQCRLHTKSSSTQLASPPPSGLIPSSSSTKQQVSDLVIDVMEDDAERDVAPYEDEGFAEMDDNDPFVLSVLEEEMSLRIASTPSGIRKYNVVRWRKSSDSVGASTVARAKVKSVPRMRKRRVNTFPE